MNNNEKNNLQKSAIKNLRCPNISFGSLPQLQKITLKNQVNRIIKAYRLYRQKHPKTISQYNQSYIVTDYSQNRFDYKGNRDSKGNKYGFGIQKMPDGSQFSGMFSNNKFNGWGIYNYKDGDIFKGEFEEDRTSGYGEFTKGNGAMYFGYWVDDMQFGIGYEIWSNSAKYTGEYNNGKSNGCRFIKTKS